MYPFYLGIDLHKKRSYVMLIDREGTVIDERRLANTDMSTYLATHVPPESFAVLEATRNWPFLYDLLTEHVARVELAHPKEVKAIASAAVKTDQIDAGVLAHLARLNYLPTAYAAPVGVRDLRQLTRHREWLVRQRTQAKNRIHAVLASYNLSPAQSDLFGQAGRQFLQEAQANSLRPAAQRVVADNLAVIDHLDQQIEALEVELPLSVEQARVVRLLKTIPGVGQLTATILLAEIGEVRRFPSAKALCNWAGLTPRVRKSDTFVRHGRISKQGSPYLRAAMVRAAAVASRCSKRWYALHERLAPRCGKQAAKVAVARHLLTVAYHMWTRQQPYQENYPQAGEPVNLQDALTSSM